MLQPLTDPRLSYIAPSSQRQRRPCRTRLKQRRPQTKIIPGFPNEPTSVAGANVWKKKKKRFQQTARISFSPRRAPLALTVPRPSRNKSAENTPRAGVNALLMGRAEPPRPGLRQIYVLVIIISLLRLPGQTFLRLKGDMLIQLETPLLVP